MIIVGVTNPSDILHSLNLLIWFITALILYFIIITYLKPASTASIPPPPSPPSLPLIGHLHLVGKVLPKSLQTLARRYGPLLELKLGASKCIVASNAVVAKEILKTLELNFASRPDFQSSECFIYRGSRFILAPYNNYWRFMKKLCVTRLLSVTRLNKFIDVREEETKKLVRSVMECYRQGKTCDLSSKLTTYTNNVICRMAMSTRCSEVEKEAEEIKGWVRTCLELAGKVHVGDILGPLKIFDFSGNGKKLMAALYKFDNIVERVIKEHEEKAIKGFNAYRRKDLIDILLEIYNDPTAEVKLTRKDIKSFLLDIFVAGTDTSSAAVQWAMGQLINHPKAFKKLRDEINLVVGPNRLVNEPDIPNLPYLRAVIRETLRLHPSAPFIIRESGGEDCKVNGFLVKAKTRVLVNVYAIMRDPDLWNNPDEFIPERFLELEGPGEKIGTEQQMDLKGQNFRYLPFGSGRRGCPGASLAMLVMHTAVGALVQSFDWKVVMDNTNDDDQKVDLSQGSGFAAEMAKPLVCYPISVHKSES